MYLSIWRAANATDRHAVIVWLTAGQSDLEEEEEGGATLSAEGEVVVVKVESRRGALAFLATQDKSLAGI